jgi:hypothetical protein
VYLVVVELVGGWPARVGGLAGAAALGLGATYWQQSVMGGPRPFTFFFTALLLWLLFRWGNTQRLRDLLLLAGAAGLSLTHHLNQALLFPALALYLLGRARPRTLRPFAPALLAFGLPLLLYLYLPLRSAMNPPLGADNLAEPRELLNYLTARYDQNDVLNNCGGWLASAGLQAQRYIVFLGLQFGPLLPFAAAAGGFMTVGLAPLAGLVLLYSFISNATFGMCSTLAMPDYIVPSYAVAAIWLGLGLAWPLRRLAQVRRFSSLRMAPAVVAAGLVSGLIAYRLTTGLPAQSMAGRTLDADRARAGLPQAQPNGLILSDWESITPIWYAQRVLGLGPPTRTAIVTAPPGSDAWLIEAQRALEDRHVALAQPVPSLHDKYRLFPIGSLYDVNEKSVLERSNVAGLPAGDLDLRLLGYWLDRPAAAPGDLIHLTLYEKTRRGVEASLSPVLRLATNPPVEIDFNNSPHGDLAALSDNEVAGQVYEFSVPLRTPPGEVPLEFAFRVAGRDGLVGLSGGRPWTRLGSLYVVPSARPGPSEPPGAVANFANQLALRGGKAESGSTTADLAAGPRDLRPRPGETLTTELRWTGLRWMDDSYTLFVHLLDGQAHLVAQQDALPLGGVYHTYKWVPGQVVTDWYRLPLPPELRPGEYWLEIGAYQSASTRRLAVLDPQSSSAAMSFLWGPIRVE